MDPIDRMMNEAVAEGVFPGAVILAGRGKEVLLHRAYGVRNLETRAPAALDTVFDLASLTKPLATTMALLCLARDRVLDPDARLDAVLPRFAGTDKAGITIEQLLRHTSGLTDYRPYFETLRDLPAPERKGALRDLLLAEPLAAAPGERTCYSDLGFMILEWAIEAAAAEPLGRFVARRVYDPLQIPLFFIDLALPARPDALFAATENCPWRHRVIEAEVHDDNAWVVGGVAGHAGLFGTAGAVGKLASEIVAACHGAGGGVLPAGLMRRFLARGEAGERPMGFDIPSGPTPACGRRFSGAAVGHLGFTGTSFWIDLDNSTYVVLMTNRVHPSRSDTRIRQFRPRIHDAVIEALDG